jgi:hypothetical protein
MMDADEVEIPDSQQVVLSTLPGWVSKKTVTEVEAQDSPVFHNLEL